MIHKAEKNRCNVEYPVLGPILFNVHINSLFSLLCSTGFADDTAICYKVKDESSLESIAENYFPLVRIWPDHKL